ncbi:MAG TPA: glutathionylspermidine synthase family protein [Terriglobales bacterium]|nr:glutathionylspermidine synthase family protein [Terriglobales bacterium]
MNLTLRPGPALSGEAWHKVRTRTIFDCCKWDVQCEDHSVLAPFPLLIGEAEWAALGALAESLAAEALVAERELLSRRDLHRRLGLPRAIRRVLRRSQPPANGVRVMRFDFHPTGDGWRLSEVNADVPGGFIEAGGFASLMAEHYEGAKALPNPAEAYVRETLGHAGPGALVALVHATAYVDDREVMEYLCRCFRSRGARAVAVSPVHLAWRHQRAELSVGFAGQVPDAVVRFFPAEWMPQLASESWEPYFNGSRTPLSNPATALVLQSKRFPLIWDDLRTPLPTWRKVMPPSELPERITALPDDEWVIKPALGRMGEDIGMRGVTPCRQMEQIVRQATRKPEEWVLQRRFAVTPMVAEDGPLFPCLGVFTVDGKRAGVYGRVARKPLVDHEAQDAAVLIHPNGGRS